MKTLTDTGTKKRGAYTGSFSKEKIDNFLCETIPMDFTHAQLNNTSYIAKYVRLKMYEICKPHLVSFTNGKATSELRNIDWRLGNLLDKVRYEEISGIDIDLILSRFNVLKKRFHIFYKERNGKDIQLPKSLKDFSLIREDFIAEFDLRDGDNLKAILDDIELFEAFRSSKGKKDRSDHRHHALDALIISLCSPSITQELSSHNASREISGISLYDKNGNLTRDKIDLPLSYAKIKESLKNILVVNKSNQRLIVSKKNKIKAKDRTIIHPSKSIRTSLHKDTYYGKLKKPLLQGIDKPEAYVTRYNSYVWDFDDPAKLYSIYDKDLQEIIRRRILLFKEKKISISKESFDRYPLYKYSPKEYPNTEPANPVSKKTGNSLPVVKKVRVVFKDFRSIVSLPKKKNAQSSGNFIMALYELRQFDKGGAEKKPIRDFELKSNLSAINILMQKEKYFIDEKEKEHYGKKLVLPLNELCPIIKKGDLLVVYPKDEEREDILDKIETKQTDWLKEHLFVIVGLDAAEQPPKKDGKIYRYGYVTILKHNLLSKEENKIRLSHDELYAIKVKIDPIGNIKRISK